LISTKLLLRPCITYIIDQSIWPKKCKSLDFYIADSEGSHFWLRVLNDLKARGVEDILIACVDGLKGFPEAIAASFPTTDSYV